MAIQREAKELVNYVKDRLGTGYVYGTFGQVLTERLLRQKLIQYPRQVGGFETIIRSKWLGKPVQDCSGLIKGFLWQDGRQMLSYQANGISDFSADSMHTLAKEKGDIRSIPEIPGLLVWKPGHIGVYIGNGIAVEANSTKSGVIKSRLTSEINETKWRSWSKCPHLKYPDQDVFKGHFLYTVVKGDSLSKIARQYLGRASRFIEIAELNGIIYPYVIHQKQVLKVPEK